MLRVLQRNVRPLLRSNTTLAATVHYRVNYHDGDATALVCPHEGVNWTYRELEVQIGTVAGGLKAAGLCQGQVFATDVMPTSPSNVILQCAASHHGLQFLTVSNADEFSKLGDAVFADAAIMDSDSSFLASSDIPMKQIMDDVRAKPSEGVTDRSLDLAFYHTDEVTSNRTVYLGGVGTAGLLGIKPEDTLCIATSTNHLFGMGAVLSGFVRNATVYLPDMDNLDLADSTLVFTDKANIDKVRAAAKKGSKLRGGVVMMEDYGGEIPMVLNDAENVDVEGTALRVLVKEAPDAKVMRYLFDACKDTYYSFK